MMSSFFLALICLPFNYKPEKLIGPALNFVPCASHLGNIILISLKKKGESILKTYTCTYCSLVVLKSSTLKIVQFSTTQNYNHLQKLHTGKFCVCSETNIIFLILVLRFTLYGHRLYLWHCWEKPRSSPFVTGSFQFFIPFRANSQ